MNTVQMHEEINEANFTYLMLARRMIEVDKAAAILCLGITEEMAEHVAKLNPSQFLKLPAELNGFTKLLRQHFRED
jgi:flagellar transcriptional activator FlhD